MAYTLVNASSQYLSTASAPASGTPMTIAAWCKSPPSGAGGRAVVSVGVNGGAHRNHLNMDNTNVQLVAAGATTSSVGNTGTVSGNNVLFHYAGVYTSATSRTGYIDGVAQTTDTINIGTQNTFNTITIGARWNTTVGNFYSNDIAEVGVWNAALTAAEIASLADGMTCDKVRPQSLVFYAPLCRDLIDVKGGLTITNNNTATVANHPRVYA